MAQTRIFIDLDMRTGAEIMFPESAARHLVQVLRLKVGDTFIAFNGKGGEFAATLSSAGKRDASANIGEFFDINRESPLHLTLAQCVSKGDRMDYTLQKAVELGAHEIAPILSARSVVKLDGDRWEKKLEHWRGIILSAGEQSGRTQIPKLLPVQTLAQWLAASGDGLHLVLAPTATKSLPSLPSPTSRTSLLVGPEGGLSDSEITQAIAHSHVAVTLGPRILRTETAGVAALSAIQALWGDYR